MKHVEEFWSSIVRNAKDPAGADKLLRIIDALLEGNDLSKAAEQSSLEESIAVRLLTALKQDLLAQRSQDSGGDGDVKPGHGLSKAVALCDGASRGNPGEGACGVIVLDESGAELIERSRLLGVVTNNVAEYEGVIFALELCAQLGVKELLLKLDSELVARQLRGEYKVKNSNLMELHEKAQNLMRRFQSVSILHVPRSETKKVDKLANSALDRAS